MTLFTCDEQTIEPTILLNKTINVEIYSMQEPEKTMLKQLNELPVFSR
jgi:hypothetical protein